MTLGSNIGYSLLNKMDSSWYQVLAQDEISKCIISSALRSRADEVHSIPTGIKPFLFPGYEIR
jgi:hypothetical protein